MKTLKIAVFMLIVACVTASGASAQMMTDAGYKNASPSWDMSTGDITKFPKGHQATTDYTPNLVTNLDKQGQPWFQSTLNPRNLRRESDKDFLTEAGKMISDMFQGKAYEG